MLYRASIHLTGRALIEAATEAEARDIASHLDFSTLGFDDSVDPDACVDLESDEDDEYPDIDQHHPGRYADPTVPPTPAMLAHAAAWMGEGGSEAVLCPDGHAPCRCHVCGRIVDPANHDHADEIGTFDEIGE